MRYMKHVILTIVVLLFGAPAWADYEQPRYIVVLQENKLAIRDYAPVMVVETQVIASRKDATGDAFRSLFRYISGNNEAELEISMTSPVAQTLASPNNDQAAETWAVRFFLPSSLSEEKIPLPKEEGVAVLKLKAQRYASISFRGRQNDKKITTNTAKLKSFIAQKGHEVSGPPVYAFYDPPFIPWFLRDNEILLPVIPKKEPPVAQD